MRSLRSVVMLLGAALSWAAWADGGNAENQLQNPKGGTTCQLPLL